MPKFDLKQITAINGSQTFYQLTIDDKPDYTGTKNEEERNKKKFGVLDKYENDLEEKYKAEFQTILGYMEKVANNEGLPNKKFKPIKPYNGDIKEYEFKSKNLRVYAIQNTGGKIIIFCGFKNSQDKDISKFQSLKSQYLKSLK